MTVCRSRWILVTLLLPATLNAQAPRRTTPAPAAPSSSAPGSVRGVVFDSLLGAPLEGARVWIGGTSASAMTDVGGRFRIDSIPSGSRVIAFEHPDLDSIGLSNNARRIQVAGGRPTVVELAVPSREALRRALCTGRASSQPAGADSGIVFGSVSDVERGMRLANARVVVAWTTARRGPDGRPLVERPVREATTDSIGNYYVCAVPRDLVVTVVAQAGRFVSGLTELLLGERGIARRDVGVSRDSVALTVDTATQLRSGRATLVGTVMDENGVPRPSAGALVDDARGEAYADEQGRFTLPNLPAGSQMLMVRMIGYAAIRLPVLLRNGDTTRVQVRLRALTALDTLRVTASSRLTENAIRDLQDRQRQGLGYFVSGEEVKRRPSIRSAFQGLPGLLLEGASVTRFTMSTMVSGSRCPVTVYVDGLPTAIDALQSYRPDQFVTLEWYAHGSTAPARYPSPNARCAVLLVWTRFM